MSCNDFHYMCHDSNRKRPNTVTTWARSLFPSSAPQKTLFLFPLCLFSLFSDGRPNCSLRSQTPTGPCDGLGSHTLHHQLSQAFVGSRARKALALPRHCRRRLRDAPLITPKAHPLQLAPILWVQACLRPTNYSQLGPGTTVPVVHQNSYQVPGTPPLVSTVPGTWYE